MIIGTVEHSSLIYTRSRTPIQEGGINNDDMCMVYLLDLPDNGFTFAAEVLRPQPLRGFQNPQLKFDIPCT